MNKTILKYAARVGAVALCSAALCSVPMTAQGGGGGGRMTPEMRVAAIDKAVALTDDQKTKINALLADDQKKMMDLRNSGEDRETMMPKMQAMRADESTKIKGWLTDDQKVKYDAYVASMPQRGGGGQGGPPPSAPPQ
jgi:protein CpxP